MALGKKKESILTPEEKLMQALVPMEEQPYKVPENWCWTTVGKVATVVTGGTPSKNHLEYYDGTFPFYKPSDLDAGRYVYEASEYLSDEGKSVSRIIPQDSTAVCCIGSIGKCGYITREGTTNQQINSAIPRFNPLYLYYFLNTDQFVNELWSKASATTISIVNKSKMEQCYFPIAPLAEQQRIVDRVEYLFAKLDEAKEKAQSVLDSFETRRAAILHKAFTGELTAKWRAEHSVAIANWKQAELGEFLLPMQTKKPSGEFFRYIDIDAIDNKNQTVREAKILPVKDAPSRASRGVNAGAVLFSMVRPYLKNIALIDSDMEDCIASTGFYVCRSKENLEPRFLYHFLCSKDAIDYLMQFMKGDNSPSIRKDDLLEMPVSMPSIPEQAEIVRILDSIFAKEQQAKEAAEAVLEKIDLLKKSILARAFRGELGTNDPTEESALELLKRII